MAENLDDGEFWLPPQFLTDDDNNINNKNRSVFAPQNDDVSRLLFASDFSHLSYPVESESSDEEEHMAELTRRVAHSLELDLNHLTFASHKPKGVFVSGSPQSTLCGCGSSSSQGSPNSVCHVTSQSATWDLLRAAAGEVERMRLNDYNNNDDERHRFGHHNHTARLNRGVGFHHPHSLTPQQLQIAQFQVLRQQQMEKQQRQGSVPVWCGGTVQRQGVENRGRNSDVGVGVGVGRNKVRGNMGLSPSAWPPLQQYGSGMRAVFLANPSGKRESSGTGVFLPRRADSPPKSRKKPACSTVLVPARVAQALNLKLEDMMPQPHQRFNGSSNMENASAIPRIRGNHVFSQQKQNHLRLQPPANREIRLPQDWTY